MIRVAHITFSAVRAWCAEVRDMQLDALSEAQRLDALDMAVHPAMWTAEPLTDALIQPAMQEQSAPPPASVTPEQWADLAKTQADDWWLDWLIPIAITGAVLWAALARLGWLRWPF